MGEPAIITAAFTVVVALLGILVQLRQLRAKVRELEEQNRQAQLLEILKKRIECYPPLWEILISYTINWPYKGTNRDWQWANAFLMELDSWNATYGLFFSHAARVKFIELRSFLLGIEGKLTDDESVTRSDFEEMYYILVGIEEKGEVGLDTHLRNDLGSYRIAAIQSSKTARKE
ncbi:MAG: hypothetical protein GY856_42415 [bacterium]|nr:hypothetical protein [bacterium]